MSETSFIPLEDFWAEYFEFTSSGSPPPRDADFLANFMYTVFGDLATHNFGHLGSLPFDLKCTDCRNIRGCEPKQSVCNTHLGIIKGVVQAMTHVPIKVSHVPDQAGNCAISIAILSDESGQLPIILARRLNHFDLHGDGVSFWVQYHSGGAVLTITSETHRVLSALTEEGSPSSLADLTGISETRIRSILGGCCELQLVQCCFDQKKEA